MDHSILYQTNWRNNRFLGDFTGSTRSRFFKEVFIEVNYQYTTICGKIEGYSGNVMPGARFYGEF
jgi:hypothetical protein